MENNETIWAVELSAVVPLEYPEPLMKGVLAHEFLHYVHHTLAVVGAAAGRFLDLTPDDMASWEGYRRGDQAVAADAAKWLTPSLRDLATRAEDDGPEIEACHERISANWIRPNLLRLVKPERGFRIDGTMRVDDSLVER